MDRYRSNLIFWQALGGSHKFIDPITITPIYCSEALNWMSYEIRSIFLKCSFSDELKFKTELETISLMVNSAERTAFELKSLEYNDKLMCWFDDLFATWKYLIGNISIYFANKTFDYYSLLRTFNEVRILIKTDSSSNGPSLHLSKRYALLWLYLRHIYYNNCNVILDIHHHHKTSIIYLVMVLQL